MNGDIQLLTPGGRAGDIFLNLRGASLSTYTIVGRVVALDGSPQGDLEITIFERRNLTDDVVVATGTTDARGGYSLSFSLPATSEGWDVFVHALDPGTSDFVQSPLLSDLEPGTHTVDLVLGEGAYQGRSEWDRITAKVDPLLGATARKDVPADRLEWLAKRADVFPLHLAMWVQAHRLADGRSIKSQSCYAFLRAGLPADLPGLVRAGEGAWEMALRSAWSLYILPPPGDGSELALASELEDEIAAMHELVVEIAVAVPASGTNHRVLFDTAGLSNSEQQEFMQLWIARTSLESFWNAVDASPTLGSTKAALFQFTIQAATLVGNHIPTLEKLQEEREIATITTVRDLAAWDYAAWDAFLAGHSIAAPDDVPGVNATEKRQNYARALARSIADAYPTASLRHRIAAAGSPPPNTAELVGFFDDNLDFDITRTNIAQWVADHPGAFAGATDPVLARANLELVQRVHRLTPRIGRYPVLSVLLSQGIESAADVVAHTRAEFVSQFSSLFSDEDHEPTALAGHVWDKAVKVHGGAMALLSKYALGKSAAEPLGALGIGKYEFGGVVLTQLGSVLADLDYCACEQCRSVFSPAAYFADLLHWIDERGSAAFTELTDRRGDLDDLLLDCANTNTVLPTIDIINELLENEFVGTPVVRQTTWTAEELRLHPEHINASVYDGTALGQHSDTAITAMVYPWALPFSLPDVEARLYLDHLGMPRHELMRRLLDGDSPNIQARVAAALGMSATERQIIAGESVLAGRQFWGFAPGAETDNWVALLAGTIAGGNVGELLRRAGIGLDELTALLHLTFIDPLTYSDITPIYLIFDESCALEDAQIANLSAEALDRLHRFVRLQRRTGIDARMLNVLIDDVGDGLDQGFLEQLVDIHWLHERLRVDYDELATWWAETIDARDYREGRQSLYRRRFFPSDVMVPIHFEPTDGRGANLYGDTYPPASLTSAHITTILAATGLTALEFDAVQAADLADDSFSFANLTGYFRVASLARALRVPVAELVQLIEVTAINPFTSPASTREFLRALDDIRRSRMSLAEIDWLLRHPAVLEPIFRDDEATSRLLGKMALDRLALDREIAKLEDPDGSGIEANLADILDSADVEEAIKILKKTSSLEEPAQTTFVTNKFASFTDVSTALTKLVTSGGTIASAEERCKWLLQEFVGKRRRQTLVVDTLAGALGLTPAAIKTLLFEVEVLPGVADALVDDYATEGEVDSHLKREFHAAQFEAYDRLAKAAIVVRAWAIAPEQIAWYLANLAHSGWLDVDALPLTPSDPDVAFSEWQRTLRALDLRSLFPAGVHGHRQMADADNFTAALAILAEHTGWDVSATTGLAFVAGELGWSTPSVFDDELVLARLHEIARTVDELGVAANVLWAWVHEPMTTASAALIKQAARARVDEARWPDIARPLRDVLRERQRDALVAAIIADNLTLEEPELQSAADISAKLLIDVETSSCMLTSRLLQATASLQTFVHRVQLGLESPLDFAAAINDWKWMKNYRVWEANRKVFLYPENWIEPDLRRDKTPEFEAFEAALAQGELSESLVERAVAGYVQRLDQLSKLEIISTWSEASDVWVLARTQADPRRWFVRRLQHTWGPWTEVPLNIQSDNAVVVVHNLRVYLFWVATEDSAGASPESAEGHFGAPARNVRIGWSELRSDGWAAPQLSAPVYVGHAHLNNTLVPPGFHLTTSLSDDEVALKVIPTYDGQLDASKLTFRFEPARKRVHAPEGFPNEGSGEAIPDWLVVGQRFVESNPVGTHFLQRPIDSQLFLLGDAVERAVIRQSDHRSGVKYLDPAWYDDHEHKYMIRPKLRKPVDDKASMGTLGGPAYLQYIGQTADSESESLDLSVGSLTEVQTIQDGLVLAQPWQVVIPGVKNALIFVPNIPKGFAPQGGAALLEESKDYLAQPINQEQTTGELSPSDFVVTLSTFHHPYVDRLAQAINVHGIWGIYESKHAALFRQGIDDEPLIPSNLYAKPAFVKAPLPIDDFDFTVNGAYSQYNWEVFFHIPLLLARTYAREQRFEEAQRWLHAVFHPLAPVTGAGETAASRFWRLKPLVAEAKNADFDQLEAMLGIGVTTDEQDAALEAFEAQVEHWLAHPFDPHAVARIRPGAYMRATMMMYFDTLLEWADDLFRQDTRESNNQAAVLYMLVAELLGPRPVQLPGPAATNEPKSWAELKAEDLDAFSNAAVAVENWMISDDGDPELLDEDESPGFEKVPLRFWYFCYPPNPKLLEYWDRVEDRLWKIRHCQNIDGITRALPLFQPPIDPALLVQATAAGLDIASVLGELDSGLGPYRFRSMLGRASEVCAELRSLGNALLTAIEKRDAEALTRIRAGHEVTLLVLMRETRIRQIEEAHAQIDTLTASRVVIDQRRAHYAGLVEAGWSGLENKHLDLLRRSHEMAQTASGLQMAASIASAFPNFQIGTGAFQDFGGVQISSVIRAIADRFSADANDNAFQANEALTTAQYLRRAEDWDLQLKQAELDLARVDRELVAAKIRLEIAERELANHNLQTAQSKELDQFFRDKFSNTELYDWMVGQLSTLYFQTYQLAFDLAKRAEGAYRHELAIPTSEARIVQFGYWDALRKGLLAGERLAKDLHRLEKAHMERDVREYELRKNISLAQLNPVALRNLQETGTCNFSVPEVLFDLDHPGHVLRRIRSVSLSIPAVVGPYTTLGARLTLETHYVRRSSTENLVTGFGGKDRIATSTAMADAGLFNLDFRDERYLPFEYAGAVSDWKLELPDKVRQFDYRTISDVVISLAYTAREDEDSEYRGDVEGLLATRFNAAFANGATQLFVVHRMFPNQWRSFLAPAESAASQVLTLPVTREHFPHFAQRKGFNIEGVDFLMLFASAIGEIPALSPIATTLTVGATNIATDFTAVDTDAYATASVDFVSATQPSTWTLTRAKSTDPVNPDALITNEWLDPDVVVGMLMLVRYTLGTP